MSTVRAIQQTKPFVSPTHEAFVALQVLSQRLKDDAENLVKESGLSLTQFNVLRILRGAPEVGLTCGEIASRLINKDPDVTRLLDRMEKQGLVDRARSATDRRVVLTHLSDAGRSLVDDLDEPLMRLHEQQLGHLGEEKLRQLLRLLEEAGNL